MYAWRQRPDEPQPGESERPRRGPAAPALSPAGLLQLQRTAGNQAVARVAAASRVLQRHGPGFNNYTYREAPNVHFERHLADWERVFGITTVEEVRQIARDLFELSRQDDWENRGGNHNVLHNFRGGKVLLAWGDGGIVSCYPKERNPAYAVKNKGGGAPATGSQMGGHGSPYGRGPATQRVGYQPKQREEQEPAPAWALPAGAYGSATQTAYPTWSATTPTESSQHGSGAYQPTASATTQASSPTVTDARQVQGLGEGQFAVYKGYTWTKNGGQLFWWDREAWTWKPRHEGQTDWLSV